MHCRKDLACVLRVPLLVLTVAGHSQQDPTDYQQEDRDIAVVDEESRLARTLESPVHRVSAKERPSWWNFLGVSDLILHSRHNKVFGLIGDGFVRRDIKEDKDGPNPNSFVQVLGLDLVGQDGT